MPKSYTYVVSACLVGFATRYDGRSNFVAAVARLYNLGLCLPVCPECLGGLAVPRLPCEICVDKILRRDGCDVTAAFGLWAKLALKLALESRARIAILKSRSPSCGFGAIYDGTFSKKLVPGSGLFARKLLEHGLSIFTEENFS